MFLTTTVLALALATQADPSFQIRNQLAREPSKYGDIIARTKARRGARVAAGKARERAEQAAAYAAQLKAEKEYKEALPYILENQRQMLQRQSEFERNAALDRMAGAAESQANAMWYDAWKRRP